MPLRVALVYPASVPWIARCLAGVRRYAREQGGWSLFSSPPTLAGAGESALTIRSLRGWKGDAILAATNEPAELRQARRFGLPVVNLAGGLPTPQGLPRVMVDHAAAGRLAAEHLLQRGLRHLAFFGWEGLWYSEQRRLGFARRAEEAGSPCATFLCSPGREAAQNWARRIGAPARWLSTLPRPVGVFAVHDYRAQLLMEACHEAGLRIPEEVAVIGMDNDEVICEHTVPGLSSVSRNSEQVGWEAAALLHRLVQGEPAPESDLLIPPDGVVARASTDRLYCADPLIQRALDFLRAHLRSQFNISTLAETLGVSKRTLELRFRRSLDQAPHDLLTRLRVQHAQRLLEHPQKRTVAEIAGECGLLPHTFHAVFRRTAGVTPAAYRKARRAGDGR